MKTPVFPTHRVQLEIEAGRYALHIELNLWPLGCWGLECSKFVTRADITRREVEGVPYEYISHGLWQGRLGIGPLCFHWVRSQTENEAQASAMLDEVEVD